MSASFDIVVLAAGKGKRMYSRLPKVLHRLAGKPLVQHVIDTARQLGPRRLCVVYGHGGDAVRDALAGSDLSFVLQEPQLGTGDAVRQALPAMEGCDRVLVLYGDVPLTRTSTLSRLLGGDPSALHVLTISLDDPSGYGRIVRDDRGQILRLVEESDASASEKAIREVNTGIMMISAEPLRRWLTELRSENAQGEFYITDIVALAVRDGIPVRTVPPDAEWEILGVNSKEQLAQLERIRQRETARTLLDCGVTLADPARIDVRGELSCAPDVQIDVNCVFEGNVRLEEGVVIGANCVLRDVRVGAGSTILPFCHFDHAVIGENCRIGPFARIRPGTEVARNVHIGNFVELKQASIGEGSKANHLSYVGDSEVGSNVNIGAGTITCNYDGINKYRTVIEDNVFIGADTQLVAPVRVGRGATIGAGTTVTQDAPAGELTLSRTRQIAIPGWKRPAKGVKREK